MKQFDSKITRKSFRETFVTKQILNEKSRKLMRPHKNQIMNQIAASIHDQQFQMEKSLTMQRLRKSLHVDNKNNQKNNQISKQNQKQNKKRPNTAGKCKNIKNYKFNQLTSYTQEKQFDQSNRFVQKLNYQINQIEKISKHFKYTINKDKDNNNNNKVFFNDISNINIDYYGKIKLQKRPRKTYTKAYKHTQPSKNFPHNHTSQFLQLQSQLQQSYRFYSLLKSKQLTRLRTTFLQSQQRQNIKKIIPSQIAAHQDIKLLTRCITGCYFDDKDDYCDSINKSQMNNIKKKFATFDTLYNMVKGERNKGIKEMKVQDVKGRCLRNYVYYVENQKTFKMVDKKQMQGKMGLND